MPDAGHLLHPAHRDPDRMVEIWLSRRRRFSNRKLVWVSGVLARTPDPNKRDRAWYELQDAMVSDAADREIASWFTLSPTH